MLFTYFSQIIYLPKLMVTMFLVVPMVCKRSILPTFRRNFLLLSCRVRMQFGGRLLIGDHIDQRKRERPRALWARRRLVRRQYVWTPKIMVEWAHKFSKNNIGATSTFRMPEGWHEQLQYRGTRILGATVQNFVARENWRPGFVHPWGKNIENI